MAVDVQSADTYFNEYVFHNEAWTAATEPTKQRALNNAVNILKRYYGTKREIADEAVFEQALWLMKVSEAQKQAERGVTSYSIDGISVSLSNVDRTIAPNAFAMLGRRVGASISGREGYVRYADAEDERYQRGRLNDSY